MPPDEQLLLLPAQLATVVLASLFTFVGLISGAIAVFGRPGERRLLAWLGVQTAMYGLRMLVETPAVDLLPRPLVRPAGLYVDAGVTYFFIAAAGMFWVEMSRGPLRRFLQTIIAAGVAVGIAGIATLSAGGPADRLLPLNQALAVLTIVVLAVVAISPAWARRYLRFRTPVLTAGLLVAAAAALYTDLSVFFSYRPAPIEPWAFEIFFATLGFATARQILADERQLLAIESEREVARRIQGSILPTSAPRATRPAVLLRELSAMLAGPGSSQLVTAAYLYLDLSSRVGVYSAAGHPPLLYWDSGAGVLRRIESNGLLFGALPDTHYPERALVLRSGDRFVLYTDGLSDAEDARGEPFGESRLPDLVRASSSPGRGAQRPDPRGAPALASLRRRPERRHHLDRGRVGVGALRQ
jgi:hypothetical protein